MKEQDNDLLNSVLGIYLAEYQALREELRFFRNARHNLLNFAILSLLGLPTITIGLILLGSAPESIGWLLLILPLPFSALCAAYAGYARSEINLARYTYDRLVPEMKHIIYARDDSSRPSLMGWGDYYGKRAALNNILGAVGELLILALPIVGSFAGFFTLVYRQAINWLPEFGLMMVIDIVAVTGVLVMSWIIFRVK